MNAPILIAATPTAFDSDGALDLASTRAIIEHTLEGGAQAVFVNGTTGEFAALTRDERRAILEAAIEVAGADRVIAHVGAASPYDTAIAAQDAARAGARSSSVLTPFYMPASLEGISRQIEAASTGDGELFLYLFPDRTGVSITPSEAAALLDRHDLAGAKISIPGVEYLRDVVAALSAPRTVLSGNDGLLREIIAAGGAGVVSGVSSSVPGPFAALVDAMASGADPSSAAAQVDEVVPVLGPSIAGLKHSLLLQGVIHDDRCRMAIDPPTAELRDRIAAVVQSQLAPPVPAI
jgi:4-hydroxy-tetrahydrodipicolinate synthase